MVAETARQNAERQRQLEEEEAAKISQLEEEAENQSQLEKEAAQANQLTEIAAMKGIGSDSSEDETEGWSF